MKVAEMAYLKKVFGDKLGENIPLAPLTTLKVGGTAEAFLNIASATDLVTALKILRTHDIPAFIIGNGSNLIVSDAGLPGVVLRLKGEFETIRVTRKTSSAVYVSAGAGARLSTLISFAQARGFSGVEPLYGIPATVGGAIRMNAGISGFSVADILSSIRYLPPSLKPVRRHASRLVCSYRSIRIPGDAVILSATFRLRPATEKRVAAALQTYRRKRDKKWMRYPSAGSIFRNPKGENAGRLVETAGLRGYQIGNAQIAPDHGNIIINKGGARAGDVLALIKLAKEGVYKKTGITLDLEVVIAGEETL